MAHAQVNTAEVTLTSTAGVIRLSVSDKGAGLDPHNPAVPGLGLINIKERARTVNGSITLESRPIQGTTLTVSVPAP